MGDEFRELLKRLNQQAKELQADFLRLKEDAADAKKRWEAKVTEIQQAIDEDYPLFDGKDGNGDSGGGGWGGGGGDDGPKGPANPPPGGNGEPIDVEFTVAQPALPAPAFLQSVPSAFQSEGWRDVPISNLIEYGLSPKTAELMDEAAIRTVGALADWNRESNRLTDIPGIGEAKAGEIEEALDQFWIDWARQQPKSGGDLVTSRPGTWINGETGTAEDKPKRTRKKKTA